MSAPDTLEAALAAIWESHARGELTIKEARAKASWARTEAYVPPDDLVRRRREFLEYRARRSRALAAVEKGRATKAKRKEWREGVARIMAEVRRREAIALASKPHFYSSDNPLDGSRLWDNS